MGDTIDSTGDGQIDHEMRFAYDGNQIGLDLDGTQGSPLAAGEDRGEGNLRGHEDRKRMILANPPSP